MDATLEALREWESRFWQRVDRRSASECWNWTGYVVDRPDSGYGMFNVHGRAMRAHRASWVIHHGTQLPVGMFVCHTCDNRRCVNPNHLFLGTARENSRDALTKSRLDRSPGSAQRTAKLTELDVEDILRRRMAGATAISLARQYGVADSLIVNICHRRAWKHVSADWYVQPRSRGKCRERARKTHCKRGHEFTPDNTIVTNLGVRRCRECHNASGRRNNPHHYQRRVAAWREENAA